MLAIRKLMAEWRADWRRFWLLDVPPPGELPVREAPEEVLPPVKAVFGKWIALRTGGGGKFETPVCFEDDAVEYVTRRGSHSIVSIDRENRYIFYADKR